MNQKNQDGLNNDNAKTIKGAIIAAASMFMINCSKTIAKDVLKTLSYMYIPRVSAYGGWTSYDRICKLLYRENPQIINKYRNITSTGAVLLSNDVQFYMKYRNSIIKVNTTDIIGDNNCTTKIDISFYGIKGEEDKNYLLSQSRAIQELDQIRVTGCGRRATNVPTRDIESIIIDHDTKMRIFNGLRTWHRSSDWYSNHHLVHKIGVLLYGKPGTGKSSLIRAISTMFNNAPIIMYDPSSGLNEYLQIRLDTSGVIIVVFEDIDMILKSRETYIGHPDECDIMNTQNKVFQLLDGVYSADNTVFVATTNHIENLDPALIRHGRFDIQEEIKYFDYKHALKFVKMFGYNECLLDNLSIEYPVQPSMLQSMIMEHRAQTILGQNKLKTKEI